MSKVSLQTIKNVVNGETTTLGQTWKDNPCVIIFFRRWGCVFCRLWAKEVSEIAPILKKNNIKLIGVGFEDVGKEEFIKGKFFDGDLYTVTEKQTYTLLGFKRFSLLSVLTSLLWKESRDGISKGKHLNLGGDLKGDGLQNGGALIMDKEGKVLQHFVQNGPAEHLSNTTILQAFGLEANDENQQTGTFQGECN